MDLFSTRSHTCTDTHSHTHYVYYPTLFTCMYITQDSNSNRGPRPKMNLFDFHFKDFLSPAYME